LNELPGLPQGTMCFSTILLGHPADNFGRIPERKPLDVSWR
jgi:hypothetical protein